MGSEKKEGLWLEKQSACSLNWRNWSSICGIFKWIIGTSDTECMKIRAKRKFSCPRCHVWLYRYNALFYIGVSIIPPLTFKLTIYETQICLENILAFMSAFHQNFSAWVFLNHGVSNIKKKKFCALKKNVRRPQTLIFGWITSRRVRIRSNLNGICFPSIHII